MIDKSAKSTKELKWLIVCIAIYSASNTLIQVGWYDIGSSEKLIHLLELLLLGIALLSMHLFHSRVASIFVFIVALFSAIVAIIAFPVTMNIDAGLPVIIAFIAYAAMRDVFFLASGTSGKLDA